MHVSITAQTFLLIYRSWYWFVHHSWVGAANTGDGYAPTLAEELLLLSLLLELLVFWLCGSCKRRTAQIFWKLTDRLAKGGWFVRVSHEVAVSFVCFSLGLAKIEKSKSGWTLHVLAWLYSFTFISSSCESRGRHSQSRNKSEKCVYRLYFEKLRVRLGVYHGYNVT